LYYYEIDERMHASMTLAEQTLANAQLAIFGHFFQVPKFFLGLVN
jgi:hypothetical protein